MKRMTAVFAAVALALLLSGAAAAADEPMQLVLDYEAAVSESAEDNRSFTDHEGDATILCTISPFDPMESRWRSAGFGTSERRIGDEANQAASDNATFQAHCGGIDSVHFDVAVQYWFEARVSTNAWSVVSDVFECETSSVPGPGSGRLQDAVISVPGSPGCESTYIYSWGDSSLNLPHRLHVHLTTSTGVSQKGVSLPWPVLKASTACAPPPVCD